MSSPSTHTPRKKSNKAPKATHSSTVASRKVSSSKETTTLEDVVVDYIIVDNMNKMKAEISMFELSKLGKKPKLLMKLWRVKEDKNLNANYKGK